MATEIFIEPELENLSDVENSTEWKIICEELDLKGQCSLADRSKENMAPPYMYIDPKTECIIRTLCPMREEIAKYDASTIPLDILKEVHKCNQHGWYEGGIAIFYDNASPDPFVIGYTSKEWNAHKHLIGRWGAELLPFEELEKKAINRLRDSAIEALASIKVEIDFALTNPDLFIKKMLSGGQPPSFRFGVSNLSHFNSLMF